jgi:hypothetical protein
MSESHLIFFPWVLYDTSRSAMYTENFRLNILLSVFVLIDNDETHASPASEREPVCNFDEWFLKSKNILCKIWNAVKKYCFGSCMRWVIFLIIVYVWISGCYFRLYIILIRRYYSTIPVLLSHVGLMGYAQWYTNHVMWHFKYNQLKIIQNFDRDFNQFENTRVIHSLSSDNGFIVKNYK